MARTAGDVTTMSWTIGRHLEAIGFDTRARRTEWLDYPASAPCRFGAPALLASAWIDARRSVAPGIASTAITAKAAMSPVTASPRNPITMARKLSNEPARGEIPIADRQAGDETEVHALCRAPTLDDANHHAEPRDCDEEARKDGPQDTYSPQKGFEECAAYASDGILHRSDCLASEGRTLAHPFPKRSAPDVPGMHEATGPSASSSKRARKPASCAVQFVTWWRRLGSRCRASTEGQWAAPASSAHDNVTARANLEPPRRPRLFSLYF